mmetsp:Transcript_86543/g.197507  ORF Transcript_86543/g.197507 Transcript_86543/m.197507 type:complete len:418 (+) Transcript_86543:326-1579(+)
MSAGTGVTVVSNEEKTIVLKPIKKCGGPPIMVHNHFEGNSSLCQKKSLCGNLAAHCAAAGKDPFDAVPLTFVVGAEGVDGAEWRHFAEVYQAYADMQVLNIWIVKPAEFSNRGCGIRIFDSLEEIQQRVAAKTGPKKSLILQKYIERPLLVAGRKFDIRSYCLVHEGDVAADGSCPMLAYMYKEAYCRTTTEKYTTDTFDKMVHLNNDAVQKKGDSYGKFEAGNKLSLDELQKHADVTVGPGKIDVRNGIFDQMRKLTTDVIRSVVPKLNPKARKHCFEIFGLDFMIDEFGKVWLIEVNTNPCLELSCSFLSMLIPQMLRDAFILTLDRWCPPGDRVARGGGQAGAEGDASRWEPVDVMQPGVASDLAPLPEDATSTVEGYFVPLSRLSCGRAIVAGGPIKKKRKKGVKKKKSEVAE